MQVSLPALVMARHGYGIASHCTIPMPFKYWISSTRPNIWTMWPRRGTGRRTLDEKLLDWGLALLTQPSTTGRGSTWERFADLMTLRLLKNEKIIAKTKNYIVVLLGLLVLTIWGLVLGSMPVSRDPSPVRIVIARGDSAGAIAGCLARKASSAAGWCFRSPRRIAAPAASSNQEFTSSSER